MNQQLLKDLLSSSALGKFLSTYNIAITVILGTCTIFAIIVLFINITKFSMSAGNEHKRSEAQSGILITLIAVGVLGSIDTVYAMLLAFIFSQ